MALDAAGWPKGRLGGGHFPAMRFRPLIKLLRPSQAYKAGIVFLPAFFHGRNTLAINAASLVAIAFAWLLAAAIIYILNDLRDAPEDRLRPERASRPIASGEISPGLALTIASLLGATLALVLMELPRALTIHIGLYVILNAAYTLGLKKHIGIQQAIIALGFWLRLKSGAAPILDIPLTPWAALFTLGLAYYLNCLKGIPRYSGPNDRPLRFAMAMGGGLAGSVAIAALIAICIKRGVEGSMAFPELPPLFCLIGMHRVALKSFGVREAKEQSRGFFMDPLTVVAMAGFAFLFLWH